MRNAMAADYGFVPTDPHKNAMDYAEHESTYARFLGMAKYGTIFVVIVLALMAFFLVR
jgi:hypothetical protein